jgi:segregation and condensation protein B
MEDIVDIGAHRDAAGEAAPEPAGQEPAFALTGASATNQPPEIDPQLKGLLEAVVYLTDEPLAAAQIALAVGRPLNEVEATLAALVADYAQPDRGLSIREVAGGYKMSTKAEHHEGVRAFVKSLKPAFKLSLAALETLAVIAYKQPITGPEIMEIRGVQGAGVLKTLLDRKLITTAGRKAVIGKPILYKTTKDFLLQFGLKDLAELPTLKEFEELRRLALSDEEPLGSGPSETPATEAEAAADQAVADQAVAKAAEAAEEATTALPEPVAEESAAAPEPQPEPPSSPESSPESGSTP